MLRETKTRAAIAALIYTMTNAVIFGIGLIAVLTLPAPRDEEVIWIPVVVVASLILAAPAAWVIAPRLRARSMEGGIAAMPVNLPEHADHALTQFTRCGVTADARRQFEHFG